MGVFDVLMHVPPLYYYFRYSFVMYYTCSDTGYQWAPLHVFVG